MTNKLPVVGQRYRHQDAPNLIVKVSSVEGGIVFFEKHEPLSLTQFYYRYEEPTDSNLQKLEECCPIETAEAAWNMSEEEVEVNEIKNIVCDPQGINFDKLTSTIQKNLYNIANEEQDFFHAFSGDLIEYQGKRYVCIAETDYLPNERSDEWKECDYSSPEYKHKKIKFRDLFAKKEVNEVERALEELKDVLNLIKITGPIKHIHHEWFYEKAINLVIALEAEKRHKSLEEFCGQKINRVKPSFENLKAEDLMSKPEPIIDMKEERVEPVSIWKDVSELPKYHCQCITLSRSGHTNLETYHYPAGFNGAAYANNKVEDALIDKYIILTDFINSFEQMQKDIEELKRKCFI